MNMDEEKKVAERFCVELYTAGDNRIMVDHPSSRMAMY